MDRADADRLLAEGFKVRLDRERTELLQRELEQKTQTPTAGYDIHLLLQTNPDGRKGVETGLSWRKNVNNDYCSNTNYRGARPPGWVATGAARWAIDRT